MAGIEPLHHSTGDWDKYGVWTLDAVIFRSAPSSWRVNDTAESGGDIKTTIVDNLTMREGRWEWYARNNAWTASKEAYWFVYYRHQDALNWYRAGFSYFLDEGGSGTAFQYRIDKKVAGVITNIGQSTDFAGSKGWSSDVFEGFRVTWWNDYVGLVNRLEKYYAGAWHILMDIYDAPNHFKTLGGRTGFRMRQEDFADKSHWNEDISIYGLPP